MPTPDDAGKSLDVEDKEERRRGKPIVEGRVVNRKRNPFAKAIETLIYEDAAEIGRYLMHDIVVPAVKDLLHDVITGGADRALYGEQRPRSTVSTGYSPRYVSYDRYSKSNSRSSSTTSSISISSPRSIDIGDYIFDTRQEAEDVLADLKQEINDYDNVNISYLKDLIDPRGTMPRSYTDNDYGWLKLGDIPIRLTREWDDDLERYVSKYMLMLPKPVYLG